MDAADSEEREQLQEPLDQISLSSTDSIEPNDDKETKIWPVLMKNDRAIMVLVMTSIIHCIKTISLL